MIKVKWRKILIQIFAPVNQISTKKGVERNSNHTNFPITYMRHALLLHPALIMYLTIYLVQVVNSFEN